jgi:hypothetical protein
MLRFRIQLPMRRLRLLAALTITAFVSSAFAGSITGVFQGTVVQLPSSKAQTRVKWLYVQGKNGVIRRANIAKAIIEYDDDFPQKRRHRLASDSLIKAAVVRVTAEQDEARDGEWQATNVLIVSPPGYEKLKIKSTTPMPTLARR